MNNPVYGGTPSTQQDHFKRKMKQKGFDINKLNGHIGNLAIAVTPRYAEAHDNIDGVLAKRRKFGNDARNVVEVKQDPDSEKEFDDFSVIFNTPPSSKRSIYFNHLFKFAFSINDHKNQIVNLRAFSNENSQFVKNIRKNKEAELKMKLSGSVKTEPIFLSSQQTSLPCYDTEVESCSSAHIPSFCKSEGAVEHSEPWVKRKFYIVENAGRPTEIYCTDFIHKVKQGVHGNRYWQEDHQDHRSLLKITDKWREEWSANGVQMPLGSNKEETYHSENTQLFPKKPEAKLFELPKKLISLYSTKYTKAGLKEFQHAQRQPLCYYVFDSTDEEWLEGEYAAGHMIPKKTFVDAMNLLEVTAYRKIHDSLLEPLRASRATSEEDADCMICHLPEWENGDNIVFCDGCNIAVHQSCYGIAEIPRGEWYCQLCAHFGVSTHHQQGCLFCPVKGGPMKATKHMENWAHIACALWIPEVRFGDVETREPIIHVNEIPAEKWQARCSVCDTVKGACIECIHPKCAVNFHVGCAQRANFVLNIENDNHNNNGVKMVSLCDKHTNSQKDRKVSLNNRLSDMLRNFTKFVDIHEISKQLGVSLDMLERIHQYWTSKRSQKNGQPLISEPEINVLASPSRNSESAKREPTSRRQIPLAAASLLYDPIPKEKLIQNYEDIRMLRLEFEKARNLCYMVKQRENLKRLHLELLVERVHKTSDILFDEQPVIPISKRRLDKLLKEWKDTAESMHK